MSMNVYEAFAANLKGHHIYGDTPFGLMTVRDRNLLCIRNFDNLREFVMPRKNKPDRFHVDFGSTFFVNARMNEKDLVKYDTWLRENEPEFQEYISQTALAGDKVSISYDLANDCIVASLTLRDNKAPGYGAVITAQSDNAYDALWLAMYKRWVFLDLDNLDTVQSAGKRG